ncbi:hypothetical protein ACFLS7_05335 [Bacteroidota bacterium]
MMTEPTSNKIIDFSISEIIPERVVVYKAQGIEQEQTVPQKITDLYDSALSMIKRDAEPKGITREISVTEFADLFHGNGMNEDANPLQHIFPRADYLGLFAFTLGKKISDTISDLFTRKDFALAYMLDSIASASVDKAASITEERANKSAKTLLYSPGYCGWHISGQEQLFMKLEPERIGIFLNPQFLMIPLKSISGVLVSGKKEIHTFDNNFTFCVQCKSFSCIDR